MTANLLDNSRIECYFRCPRRYFYRYHLGWRGERTSVHLVWGEAWHRVMAAWYTNQASMVHQPAPNQLRCGTDYYREHFSPADDENNAPKTCAALGVCFKDYVKAYEKEDTQFTTLAVEIGFKLEIAPGVWMSGRIDQILQDNLTGDIIVRDHKSASQLPDMKGVNQWQMSTQAACYLTAAKRKYPEHYVREFEVNIVVPRKVSTSLKVVADKNQDSGRKLVKRKQSPTGLTRISVGLEDGQLGMWCWEAEQLSNEILWQEAIWNKPDTQDTQPTMATFRRTPTSCYDFHSLCTYFDQCSVWTDPLKEIKSGPPRGMVVDHWDPLVDLKCSEVWKLPLEE